MDEKHKRIIRHELEDGWLDDDIVAAAQYLLKKDYPEIEGLNPPATTKVANIPETIPPNFVQILQIKKNHWIVISTVDCDTSKRSVNVYDSLCPPEKQQLKECNLNGHTPTYVPVQQQKGGDDCGLFAIANSVSICARKNFSELSYCQEQMRARLLQCIENERINSFPFEEAP